jgi:hypothetical protein
MSIMSRQFHGRGHDSIKIYGLFHQGSEVRRSQSSIWRCTVLEGIQNESEDGILSDGT